jgi:heme-degrading monooxygenase HmoA
MYAVMRHYTGASALADALVQRQQEVTQIINTVPGFRAYYALRTGDGKVATITVCDDQAGTQESSRRAAAWVRENMSGASISPPEIIEGETFLNF